MAEKFYQLAYSQRLEEIKQATNLSQKSIQAIIDYSDDNLSSLVENYLTNFDTPIGVVRNITIDDRSYVVPIATEEPSVIAAANNGAKRLKKITTIQENTTLKVAQILSVDPNIPSFFESHWAQILQVANESYPNIVKRKGGLKEYFIQKISPQQFSVNLLIDTKEAMGANIVDTIAESIGQYLNENNIDYLTAIVSNFNDQSVVKIKASATDIDENTAQKIIALSQFGKKNIYRATTENKGILNGASGVVLATGNDWRAFEAGVHAFASRSGQYQSLTSWHDEDGVLVGEIQLPIALGTVGGTINNLPIAHPMMEMMSLPNAKQLASIVAAIGLAQNFSALLAQVTEGIQKGHMKMQQRANKS